MIPGNLVAPPEGLTASSFPCRLQSRCSFQLPHKLACRRQLADIPMSHVWPYQEWLDADRACFMSRQYIHSSLFQRLSTRPFLTQAEKVGNTISGCSAHLVIDSVLSVMLCGCAGRHQRLSGGALQTTLHACPACSSASGAAHLDLDCEFLAAQ